MVKINNKVWGQEVLFTDGEAAALADRTEQLAVLYFYPRANTPGCTNESKDFSTHYQAFKEAGCEVFGVSMDSLKKQQNVKNKYDMPFELIADTDEWLCQELDVIKEKKMYGKTFMGIERSTFIVNSAGEILKTWRKVKVPGHVEEVLDAVKALS